MKGWSQETRRNQKRGPSQDRTTRGGVRDLHLTLGVGVETRDGWDRAGVTSTGSPASVVPGPQEVDGPGYRRLTGTLSGGPDTVVTSSL